MNVYCFKFIFLLLCFLVSAGGEVPIDYDETNDLLAALPEYERIKYVRAPGDKIIAGDYLIVLNRTRIEEIEEFIKELSDEEAELLKAYVRMQLAKISISDDPDGDGNITIAEKRINILRAFLNSSVVEYIEEDRVTELMTDQNYPPSWGLDRVDQSFLPLNRQYHYDYDAGNVTAYVIDTGIRSDHEDFKGRATCEFSAIPNEDCEDTFNGHGTHVAGTIGGTEYGIAKGIKLVGIKVLGGESGAGSNSGVIDGINYVLAEKIRNPLRPIVVNMSLGGGRSQALDRAVETLVSQGIFVAVAAGNDDTDACSQSPARVEDAMTVGSTDQQDQRSSFSNWGECVDIFAPGSSITSTYYTSSTATSTLSGTSMASPHVAGVAALYLSRNPLYDPAELKKQMIDDSVIGAISDTKGSPNVLLNTNALFTSTPAEAPSGGFQSASGLLGLYGVLISFLFLLF